MNSGNRGFLKEVLFKISICCSRFLSVGANNFFHNQSRCAKRVFEDSNFDKFPIRWICILCPSVHKGSFGRVVCATQETNPRVFLSCNHGVLFSFDLTFTIAPAKKIPNMSRSQV